MPSASERRFHGDHRRSKTSQSAERIADCRSSRTRNNVVEHKEGAVRRVRVGREHSGQRQTAILDRFRTGFTRTDADDVSEIRNENLTVANLTRAGDIS